MSRDLGAPRWYQDIPWRLAYRLRWLGYVFLGPAQLEGDSDPLVRLKRERKRRYAVRAAKRRLTE
jgi:hypothetical protein